MKIKTPYGDKNWEFVKRCFDNYENLIEACEMALDFAFDYGEDCLVDNLQRVINNAKGV